MKNDMKARSHRRLELPCFWIYGWSKMSFVLVFVFFMLFFFFFTFWRGENLGFESLSPFWLEWKKF